MNPPASPAGESLPRGARLLNRNDFRHVFRGGRRCRSSHLHLVLLENSLGYSRIGLAVSRKVGGSVVRNLIKRRLRELFRRNRELLKKGTDVVVIPQPGVDGLTFQQLADDFLGLLSRTFAAESSRPRGEPTR